VLACYRYIELNPVRADMVRHPREYPWSSHAANAYEKEDSLLVRHAEYQRLGGNEAERKQRYRELFSAHMDVSLVDEIRQSTNGNFVLGKGRFVEEIERTLKQRAIPGRSGRPATKQKEI
jgi:putative transposase